MDSGSTEALYLKATSHESSERSAPSVIIVPLILQLIQSLQRYSQFNPIKIALTLLPLTLVTLWLTLFLLSICVNTRLLFIRHAALFEEVIFNKPVHLQSDNSKPFQIFISHHLERLLHLFLDISSPNSVSVVTHHTLQTILPMACWPS